MTDTITSGIEALLGRFMAAYSSKDADAVVALFNPTDAMVVGTGHDEVRFGTDEVRAQVERDFSQSDELSATMSGLRVVRMGEAAFAFCEAMVSGSAAGRSFEMGGLRATFGLVDTPSGWQIAQLHLSVANAAQAEGESFEP